MKAMILSIGDELVLGQTVDANSAWLSGELASIGWPVAAHLTVGDDQSAIESAILQAAGRCDVLLVTGGLGPTRDDLTRAALAGALAQPLEMNAQWLGRMEQMFRRRGRPMADANRAQALIPRGARIMENGAGTAAGIDAEFTPPASSRPCRIFAMPGVPREMRIMFQQSVRPILWSMSGGTVILTRALHTFGVGESNIGEMLGDLMDRGRNPSVGTTVSNGVVSLRITSWRQTRDQADEALLKTVAECRRALGELIYGADGQSLPSVIGDLLTSGPIRQVATAESCTGGLLAKMLTDVAGSSRYFQRGWITYSDEAKTQMLDVDAGLIARDGAVSEAVVGAMAEAARRKSGADFALAISGIAGPDGGTPAKPVGTVCVALAHASGRIARTFSFPGDREAVRDRSAKMALTMLRYHLLGKQMPF